MTHRNLLDRIRAAQSENELNELLREGEQFKEASDRTRSRWRKKAAKRSLELVGRR